MDVIACVSCHGKQAPCNQCVNIVVVLQGDKVKKGQTVAYIEQLGTFVPVEVRTVPLICAGNVLLGCFELPPP